ncbi:unnamed protein product [Cunninghamella blakesleeana]
MQQQDNNDDFNLIPGFEIISLTADEPDYYYDDNNDQGNEYDETMIHWVDDCEAQENLFQILPLTPEEAICDQDNHIVSSNQYQFFFEELGYFSEEPESIDPSRDYEMEYQIKMNHQQDLILNNNKRLLKRQHHIDLEKNPLASPSSSSTSSSSSSTTSITSSCHSPDLSSAASSFHHTEDDDDDFIRSPYHLNRPYVPYQYNNNNHHLKPPPHQHHQHQHHQHHAHISSNLRY